MQDNLIRVYHRTGSGEGKGTVSRAGIYIPEEGETVVVKFKKIKRGPRPKTLDEFLSDSGGVSDFGYQANVVNNGVVGKVAGVYSRYLRLVYAEERTNTLPHTISYADLITRDCTIRPFKKSGSV